MQDFNGKLAVLTGAGSGIGRALALQLAREGCDLALCDIFEAPLEERKVGSLGLHLIQRMVDTLEYDYRDGRSRIRFSKEQASDDV